MAPGGDPDPPVRISVIVISYNVRTRLGACLRSIAETLQGTPHEVIVVDNGSSDGTVEMVAREFPDVRIVANERNVGFCMANNQGIAKASGQYVMLLNPDTELLPGAVHLLLAYLSQHTEVWAVGPDLPQPTDPIAVLACGYQPTLRRAFNQYFFLTALRPRSEVLRGINLYRHGAHKAATEVEWISGACILTRASVLATVGGLDEGIFLYTDDFEWCRRVIRAGGKIMYLPEAVVMHYAGSSARAVRHWALWIWAGAWIDYFRRTNGVTSAVPFAFIVAFGYGFRAVLGAVRLLLTRDSRFLASVQRSVEVSVFSLLQLPVLLFKWARREPIR